MSTHIGMFSGVGGFELAARLAGFETVQMCEIDPFCQSVLSKNFPGVPIHDDITTFDGKSFRGRIDLLTGGFPCQDVSVANTNGAGLDGEKTGLWRELLRLVCEIQPRFCLFENVGNLINRGYDRVAQDLDEAGYEVESYLLGADDIGATHRRKRIWIVAYNRRLCRWNLPEIERRLDPSSELWGGDHNETVRSGRSLGDGDGAGRGERGGSKSDGEELLASKRGISPMADVASDGEDNRQRGGESQLPETLNGNAAVGDMDGEHCELCLPELLPEHQGNYYPFSFPPAPEDYDRWEVVARTHPHLLPCIERKLLPMADGLPAELVRRSRSAFRAESRKKNATIKALGNALVPACAYPLLLGIKRILDMMEEESKEKEGV